MIKHRRNPAKKKGPSECQGQNEEVVLFFNHSYRLHTLNLRYARSTVKGIWNRVFTSHPSTPSEHAIRARHPSTPSEHAISPITHSIQPHPAQIGSDSIRSASPAHIHGRNIKRKCIQAKYDGRKLKRNSVGEIKRKMVGETRRNLGRITV